VFRRSIGRFVEWALGYEREIICSGLMSGMPKAGYPGDAGFDLYTFGRHVVKPCRAAEIHTGVCIDSKAPIWFEIKSRSSTFRKYGLEVQDAIIDNGYRGELYAIVYNPSGEEIEINDHDRICQIVPHLLIPCRFKQGVLGPSDRGTCGFGSTGI
jgi:deoxyuridine 5'-triphosphate nucleotidohydrolase